MLHVVYLDEFGHIGPYVAHDDLRHKTHPAFGLGGFAIPYTHVRKFSTFFFKLKKSLLKFEIDRSNEHPARWEKKGSALYTIKNINRYRELRTATNRILNQIRKNDGFVFYVGIEKHRGCENQDSKNLFHAVMREAIKRLDQECELHQNQFLLVMDQQEDNVFRPQIVQKAAIEMFGSDPKKTLIEPPIQAESHLYQTLQCADWICGIIGRLSQYEIEPLARPELADAKKYFGGRIAKVSRRSGIRRLLNHHANYVAEEGAEYKINGG